MATGFVIRKDEYYDSVFLMGISKRISDVEGVRQNAVLMGSDTNKGLLSSIGIQDAKIDAAQPDDLIVGIVADNEQVVQEVLGKLDEYLMGGVPGSTTSNPHSLHEAVAQKPNANLAVISVPGEYAAQEAHKALEAGLNVFLFSDNVSTKDELELKRFAIERHLLVMGPDCGTAIIGGVGIGFANVVRRGPIGTIGVAGTGLQEFTSQVHTAGSGISHAIGTGGHDLSDEIGGLTTFAALEALEADPQTRVIAIVSKPPSPQTLTRLIERIRICTKPVIGCFLGTRLDAKSHEGVFQYATTIDEAVQLALYPIGENSLGKAVSLTAQELENIAKERALWNSRQKYLRGVFAGGTFCYQSQQILRDGGITVHSNAPLESKHKLIDSDCSREHTIVDMGADEYTVGRPHPMIDGTLRKQRILAEAQDPETAVLLLDFILGYNASMEPVAELLDAIREAKQAVANQNGKLTVVASVCGTDGDPQILDLQVRLLIEAGVFVFQSNAKATSFCCELLKQSRG
jgi:succinyl-CoA synthetase alpha subunit